MNTSEVNMAVTKKTVLIIATGGTIAGTSNIAGDNVGYQAATLSAQALVASVPGLSSFNIETEQVSQIDSKDMSHEVWLRLAICVGDHLQRDDLAGIVITHGTDTLEESAYFLHRLFSPVKPVVFTAAMRPSDALMADGPQNLLDAVYLAAQDDARGVMAVMLGKVMSAEDVRKTNGYDINAFECGDAGVLGLMIGGQLRRFRDWPTCQPVGVHILPRDVKKWPDVAIWLSYTNSSIKGLEALCKSGIDGLIIGGTGNGTVHDLLLPVIREAMAHGLMVYRASRCLRSGVVGEAELPSAGPLSLVQARVEIMLIELAKRADVSVNT